MVAAAMPDPAALGSRLDRLTQTAVGLQAEGVPFPIDQVRETYERAVQMGDVPQAALVIRRAEVLCERTQRDWSWVRELLLRADETRELAVSIGVDVQHLDSRVGNPRAQLRAALLSGGALERAAASASLALAVLDDTIPKFCIQEVRSLGEAIRDARNRGEDVRDAAVQFQRFLAATDFGHVTELAHAFLDVRRAVARIPRAPAVPVWDSSEEEEILDEARNLARRLHRIKRRARDAQSAARLASEVRAALSEDRRFGTPEEEIEELWNEVDRLTKVRSARAEEAEPNVPEPPADKPEAEEVDPPPVVQTRSSRSARSSSGPARTSRP
ncbi:MAG: hypothetical protein WCA77_03285 [Thermoplasmata archaeon]